MTDDFVKLGCVAAVLALSFGLWAAWARGQWLLLAGLNAVVALGTLLVSGANIAAAIRYNETPMLLYFALQASVLITFALLLSGIRVPNWIIVVQAAINMLLLALLAVFLFSFRLTKLF